MRFTILGFTFLIFLLNYSQSKHGFEVGLDSTALANEIKSKTIYTIELDSNKRDTSWTKKYVYLPNGFVKRYEEIWNDYYNKSDPSDIWNLGHNWVDFEYNTSGYLIDEKMQWSGPVNISDYTDTMIIVSTKKETYIDKVLRESILIGLYDTLIQKLNQKGLIEESKRLWKYTSSSKYIYHSSGLLKEVLYLNDDDKIYMKQEYTYEFYEK